MKLTIKNTIMRRLKYNYVLAAGMLALMTYGFSACNDGLADELFRKNSYIIHNGWQDYELTVKDDNTAQLPIYFGVNGTSGNDKNITLTLAVDPDTLSGYNREKYKNQTDLYYKILPEESYTFDAEHWTIKKGNLNTAAYITIDLNKIEESGSLYDDYVLPLCISSSTGEPMGEDKYTKVLAHIGFKNDYSGSYSGQGVVTQQGTTYTTETTGTQLYAINNDVCYMFVGNKTRSNTTDYLNYVVEIHRDVLGDISLVCKNEALQFEPYNAVLTRKYTYNYTDQRYYTEVTTLQVSYRYLDSTLYEPLTMTFEGTFSMSRDVLRVEYPDVDVEE